MIRSISSACMCVLLATGCGGGGSSDAEKKTEKAEKAEKSEKKAAKGNKSGKKKQSKRESPKPDPAWNRDLRDLDTVAEKIGELVRVRDLEGLEALWIRDEAFVDCHVTDANLEAEDAAELRAQYSKEFRKLAATQLSAATTGELVFINRRGARTPNAMGGRFVGDDCNVEHWARVNAIVFPDATPEAPIEHRFNLLMVDGAWKIYEYVPERPDCAGEGKNSIGCRKLRERTNPE